MLSTTNLLSAIRTADVTPSRRLFILNKVLGDRIEELHNQTQARIRMHRQIAELQEEGSIAVMWSGRDCDGVQYSGSMRMVAADPASVIRHIDETYEWADGPCSWTLMRPSEAIKVLYQSRDLTLEAFEDGHPHGLYA
jgi:hypothetical protein